MGTVSDPTTSSRQASSTARGGRGRRSQDSSASSAEGYASYSYQDANAYRSNNNLDNLSLSSNNTYHGGGPAAGHPGSNLTERDFAYSPNILPLGSSHGGHERGYFTSIAPGPAGEVPGRSLTMGDTGTFQATVSASNSDDGNYSYTALPSLGLTIPGSHEESSVFGLGPPSDQPLLLVSDDPYMSQALSQPSSTSSTPAPSGPSTSSTSTTSKSRGQQQQLKRFACTHPGCDKSFSTSGHLARHIRVHTGEKAFQCTFAGCESRFSRHDNMLQHYRNHIVRNARRRKKAFATAVSSTSSAGDGEDAPVTAPAPTPSSRRAPAPAGSTTPVFIHSPYSSYQPGKQAGRSTSAAVSAAKRAAATTAAVAASSSYPSQPRPPSLRLDSLQIDAGMPYMSPPLASPSVMDRPHTAATSFFPMHLTPSGPPMHPMLTHRHSYSTLPSQPVLEPITPTSELPSYPYPYPYPPSPVDYQYSPGLYVSPQLQPVMGLPGGEARQYLSVHNTPDPSAMQYAEGFGPATTYQDLPPSEYFQPRQRRNPPPPQPQLQATPSGLGSHNPLLSGLGLDGMPVEYEGRPQQGGAFTPSRSNSLTEEESHSDGAPPVRWLRRPENSWQSAHSHQQQYPHQQPQQPRQQQHIYNTQQHHSRHDQQSVSVSRVFNIISDDSYGSDHYTNLSDGHSDSASVGTTTGSIHNNSNNSIKNSSSNFAHYQSVVDQSYSSDDQHWNVSTHQPPQPYEGGN